MPTEPVAGTKASDIPRGAFVIVGASLAGASAAIALCDEGADGTVTLIGAEPARGTATCRSYSR